MKSLRQGWKLAGLGLLAAATLVTSTQDAHAQSTAGLGLEATLPATAYMDQEGPDYILSETLIADLIVFDKGRTKISRQHRDVLKRLAKLVKERPDAQLAVYGHAAQGESNAKDLSMQRATAVQKKLLRLGIPIERINLEGKGDSEALDASRLNRRVEFKLHIKIAFDENIQFDHKEHTPLRSQVLDDVAQRMKKHDFVRLRILGHADNNEGKGRADLDRVGLDRAAEIRRGLIARGIDANRLSIVSLGDRAAKRSDGPNNRRVTFRLLF